jgi:hypothetical protein
MRHTTKAIVTKLAEDIAQIPGDVPVSGEDLIGDAIEQAVAVERERCAKIADYWGAGNWKAQDGGRSRFSLQDLQATCNTTGRGIAEDIRNLSEKGAPA